MTEQAVKPRRRRSALKRQRLALLIVLAVVAVLAVTLIIVWRITSRITFTDLDAAGTKYYVVKKGGAYLMQDADKNTLPQDEDGNYVTAAGTLVLLNAETGETTIIAVVASSGTEQLDFSAADGKYDILMYPKLERTGADPARVIASIEVHNRTGSFAFVRSESDDLVIEGHPNTLYSETMLVSLVTSTGYTKVLDRLPLSAVRQYGYAEYGLPENAADAEVWFTITAKNGTAYTVVVGDEILSGAGYYVRNAASDEVYIIKEVPEGQLYTGFSGAVLAAVEDYVTPMAFSLLKQENYHDVTDFTVYQAPELTGGSVPDTTEFAPVIKFSYVYDMLRKGTFYANTPYIGEGVVDGFSMDATKTDDCLVSMQTLTPFRTVKLGREDLSPAAFAEEYGVAYLLEFVYNTKRAGKDKNYEVETAEYNLVWISPLSEDDTYFLYNEMYDMIVEVDSGYLNFLEWGTFDWIKTDFISGNIGFCEEIAVEIHNERYVDDTFGRTAVTFVPDQSQTQIDKEKGTIDTSKLTVSATVTAADGTFTNPVNTTQFRLFYMTLVYTYLQGNMTEMTAAEMDACRAAGAAGADVVIRITYTTDDGPLVREYCFYSYPGTTKMFTTLNGNGTFYCWQPRLQKIANDLGRVFDTNQTIDPTAKD